MSRTMMLASAAQQRLMVNSSSRDNPHGRVVGGARNGVRRSNNIFRCEAGSSGGGALPRLPRSPREQVNQAAEAVRRAASSGKQQFEIEFSLPLIGATDLDDWPGGIRQQYKAVAPMVGEFLKGIGLDDKADVKQEVVEEGDAVVVLKTAGATAMVFPTAETLPALKRLVADNEKGEPIAIVNSQIRTNDDGSNLISDLGFGPWKRKNEQFLAQFELAYWVSEQRIEGETVRLLKAWPYPWQVYVLTDMDSNNTEPDCIKTFEEKPSYKELKSLLVSREGSVAAMSIIDRVKREAQFNATSVSKPPNNVDQE